MAATMAFAAALLGFAIPSRAAVECQAEVRGQFRGYEIRDEIVAKTFLVEISSSEKCAKVSFELITTQRRFSGEEITSTRREWQKRECRAEHSDLGAVSHAARLEPGEMGSEAHPLRRLRGRVGPTRIRRLAA